MAREKTRYTIQEDTVFFSSTMCTPRPRIVVTRPCVTMDELQQVNPHIFDPMSDDNPHSYHGCIFTYEPRTCPTCLATSPSEDSHIMLMPDGRLHDWHTQSNSALAVPYLIIAPIVVCETLPWIVFPFIYVKEWLWLRIVLPWSGIHVHIHTCPLCHCDMTDVVSSPLDIDRVRARPRRYTLNRLYLLQRAQ